MKRTWTPEPWWDESGCAHAKAPEWTEEVHSCVHPIANQNGTENDSWRACECVNACAGINPEAVPVLLEAGKRAEAWFDKHAESLARLAGACPVNQSLIDALALAEKQGAKP